MVKQDLQKYGLQKGHIQNWDLQLPWLIMGYKFNQQASPTFHHTSYYLAMNPNY
jgi:hypothetical protein